jgi:hypothetical protein
VSGGQRSKRRKVIFWTCIATLVVTALAELPIAFVAATFFPPFKWAALFVGVVFGLAGWWVVRDWERDQKAAAAWDDTEVLDLAEIAGHRPPRPPQRTQVSMWHRIAARAKQTKEGAL